MNFKTESGRSMVEMLGTLAIIGVLSIGGIMGYSYGMDKYRANETINDVNLRGIDLVRQVAMGQTLSLSEWPTTSKAGYTINEATLNAGNAYFSISGIPQGVCKLVYAGIQNNQTTKVDVNGTLAEDASACNKEEDNTMGFFFITNASEGGTTPEDLCKNKTCPEGYSCTHGICMSEELPNLATDYAMCSKNEQCGECQYCLNNTVCAPKEDGAVCESDNTKFCQSGLCVYNKICTDNSNCDYGYYCGKLNDSDENKACIKADFYKITLNTGEDIYLVTGTAWRPHKKDDADTICQSIGMNFIDNYENRMDVVEKLASLSPYGSYFFSASQTCNISPSGLSCHNGNQGSIVCVKENKTLPKPE